MIYVSVTCMVRDETLKVYLCCSACCLDESTESRFFGESLFSSIVDAALVCDNLLNVLRTLAIDQNLNEI